MEVLGQREVIAELLGMKNQTFRRVVDAVEKTAVRMANDAKSGHERGSDPHSRDRYENRTTNLTNSIFPGGSDGPGMKWEKVTESEVVGLFGVESTAPGSPMEYAPYVEERYPFIWPAVVANVEYFTQELKKAAPGGRK